MIQLLCTPAHDHLPVAARDASPGSPGRRPARRTPLRSVSLGLAVASLALFTGCADDADDGAASDPTTTAASDVSGDTAVFCDAVVAVDEATLPLGGPSDEPPDPAVVSAAGDAMTAAGEAAPDEIAEAVGELVTGGKQMLETGETPEGFEEASAETYGWVGDNCGFADVSVTAKDYEYEGMPSDLDAGPALLTLANEGTELHEMMFLRVNDGVTESADELLAMPEDEAMTKVEMAGASFAMPGETGQVTADLRPGRYIVACFIPVGLTPEAAQAGESGGEFPDGPPHFTQGMVHEITVA